MIGVLYVYWLLLAVVSFRVVNNNDYNCICIFLPFEVLKLFAFSKFCFLCELYFLSFIFLCKFKTISNECLKVGVQQFTEN